MTNVLDKGYVNLVESWGSDERIIEAARMSTNKGFQGWGPQHEVLCRDYGKSPKELWNDGSFCNCQPKPGDEKLLTYLWANNHHTPFEMAGATFEIYAPIFVIREWHRHRTFSYNEMSGRYVELPNDYYLPTIDRIKAGRQSLKNKQGSEEGFTDHDAHLLWEQMQDVVLDSRRAYEKLLAQGVSREVARMVLPVSQYSRFRASGNLRNWLHFLRLRLDQGAQWEIRQYANAVGGALMEMFPRTYELFARELPR